MAGRHPFAKISTDQWTLAFCMVNVLASVVHRTNAGTLIVLSMSAAWLLSGKRATMRGAVFGIGIGMIAGMMGLWRQSHGLAIGMAVVDAVVAVALLQCYFSPFSLPQSLIFLLRQSIRLETIYVIFFAIALVLLPQFYKRDRVHNDYDKAMTGLNTEVGPGGIAKLAQSDRVAFMVQVHDGTGFKVEDLYWSAARLSEGDGLVWRQSKDIPYTSARERSIDKDSVRQEISILGGGSRVIVALDSIVMVRPLTKGISIDEHAQQSYVAKGTTRYGALRYEAWSQLKKEEQAADLTPSELVLYTNLASPANDRVTQLATSLDLKPGDPMVAAHSIENYFRDRDFTYSLDVSRSVSTVSDFLFEGKKGFCEHYAATFAVLMRTLHYPVRLVVGYQGGLRSRITSKIIVRDQDAHVWTEVWSKKQRRWVRFDPTAAVAPDRITRGSDSIKELSSRPFYLHWLPVWSMAYSEFAPDLLALADAYDNRWINAILDRVVATATDYLGWLAIILGAFVSYLCVRLVMWGYRRINSNPLARVYHKYLRGLAKRGVAVEASDTVMTLSKRATTVLPMTSHSPLLLFAEEFNRLKYSNHIPQNEDLKNLRRLLSAIFR